MHPAIAQHRAYISAICQRYQIRRLEVFGSAARGDDFDAEHSDADFLVEFSKEAPADLHRFFGIKSELESLLGRGVDLIEPGAVRNPFVLDSINQHHEATYAA
jgi:predicted nucleotidyltransferase